MDTEDVGLLYNQYKVDEAIAEEVYEATVKRSELRKQER
jgi:hypothetical protein